MRMALLPVLLATVLVAGLAELARADVWSAQSSGPLSGPGSLSATVAGGSASPLHGDLPGASPLDHRAKTLEILLDQQRTRTGLTDDKLFAQRVSQGIDRAKRLYLTLGRSIAGVPLDEARHLYKDCSMFMLDPVFLSEPDAFDMNDPGGSLSTYTVRFCGWTFSACRAAWSWGMYARWVRQFNLEHAPG